MERFDQSRSYVFRTIVANNRLDAYEKYIENALRHDYCVCSLIEFFQNRDQGKHFILRHDVDYKCSATKKMYLTEKSMGIHSTYYFRKTTIDIDLMNQMIDDGFEVGFHYETLSDYAIENKKSNITQEDIEKCRELLKTDIKRFNSKIKKPITSIAGHGSPKNNEIGESNNVIIQNQNYSDFGIVFESYDKELYAHDIDVHIMDNNIRRNYGFSYKDNPIDAVNADIRNIVFLSHPNHWYYDSKHWVWNIVAFVLGRCSYESNSTFKRILDRGGFVE